MTRIYRSTQVLALKINKSWCSRNLKNYLKRDIQAIEGEINVKVPKLFLAEWKSTIENVLENYERIRVKFGLTESRSKEMSDV